MHTRNHESPHDPKAVASHNGNGTKSGSTHQVFIAPPLASAESLQYADEVER